MAFSYTIIGLTLLADDCTIHSVTKQKMNNTIGVIRCGWKGISIPGRCYDNNFACTTGLYVNGLDIVYIFVQCLYKIGLIVLMIMSSSKYSHVRNLNQLSQGVATVCVSLCPLPRGAVVWFGKARPSTVTPLGEPRRHLLSASSRRPWATVSLPPLQPKQWKNYFCALALT